MRIETNDDDWLLNYILFSRFTVSHFFHSIYRKISVNRSKLMHCVVSFRNALLLRWCFCFFVFIFVKFYALDFLYAVSSRGYASHRDADPATNTRAANNDHCRIPSSRAIRFSLAAHPKWAQAPSNTWSIGRKLTASGSSACANLNQLHFLPQISFDLHNAILQARSDVFADSTCSGESGR